MNGRIRRIERLLSESKNKIPGAEYEDLRTQFKYVKNMGKAVIGYGIGMLMMFSTIGHKFPIYNPPFSEYISNSVKDPYFVLGISGALLGIASASYNTYYGIKNDQLTRKNSKPPEEQ